MSTGHVLEYQAPQTKPTSRLAWLGWAVYLAMSWTWCIGMFLPVLLVRDYGVWGWVVFAIPNVLGAAAMGWILRSRQISLDQVDHHTTAMVSFSSVTAAFQIFCAGGFLRLPHTTFAVVGIAVLILAVVSRGDRASVVSGAAVLAIAIFCIAASLVRHGPIQKLPAPAVAHWQSDLAALAPVFAFGFLLCPYLDLTFHYARQKLVDHAVRRAFGVGFGAIFLAMIAFSLWYSAAQLIDAVLAVYFVVQLGFTTAVHWEHAIRQQRNRLLGGIGIVSLTTLIGTACIWSSRVVMWSGTSTIQNTGEFIYRLFMGFYGLVFPAYVWLCMIPGRGRAAPDRWQLVVFAIAVLVAAPMFWLGFIEGRMACLLPGLSVVLLARLLIPHRSPET